MNSNRYFNEVANQWDTMRTDFFSEAVREKAYSVVKLKEGNTVADIGAGTGFITEGLVKKSVHVVAVDYSHEMLKQIKEKFKDYSTIDFRQGESANLPIETNQVDHAMANMYLHHVENPLAAIKEMVRITKQGGKIVITDLDEHNYDFLKTEHYDRWLGFKREDIKQWFAEAGLKNITVDCVGGNCCTTSECGNESANISIFIASGEK